jgi:hypothetical protein
MRAGVQVSEVVTVMVTGMVTYRTSSYSFNNGACVEVGNHLQAPRPVVLRDSKDADGPTISVSSAGWRAFIARIKEA